MCVFGEGGGGGGRWWVVLERLNESGFKSTGRGGWQKEC